MIREFLKKDIISQPYFPQILLLVEELIVDNYELVIDPKVVQQVASLVLDYVLW